MPTSFTEFNPGDYILDTHIEQFIEPIQNLETGAAYYAPASGGTTNTFDVALSPAPASYTEGMIVNFKSHIDVSGAASINVNGMGPKSLVKEGGVSLVSGDIIEDQMVSAIYDGAGFQLLSPVLQPTSSSPGANTNRLVYAEVAPGATLLTNRSLPDFDFDSGTLYLLEMTIGGVSSTPSAASIVISNGSTDYEYPGTGVYVGGQAGTTNSATFCKLLPTLSGSHTLDVNVISVGFVEVKIFEVNDNLVYADFCEKNDTSTVASHALTGFVAASGHIYEMVVTASATSSSAPALSAYVTDGTDYVGLPSLDPVGSEITGVSAGIEMRLSKLLTGLSGSYDVYARLKSCSGVTVRIYDIT